MVRTWTALANQKDRLESLQREEAAALLLSGNFQASISTETYESARTTSKGPENFHN